jgi:hypothetical protein
VANCPKWLAASQFDEEDLLTLMALDKQIVPMLDAETDKGAVREAPLHRIGAFTLPPAIPRIAT